MVNGSVPVGHVTTSDSEEYPPDTDETDTEKTVNDESD